ncbi:IclR family transcriptional regulator [Aestuariivita boseongensis]|uniref:IclR family transcriptional regulator n=1 Tax=Aestuariivita boseongensis TaxID=1470562 RepID=UPI00068285A9|nr:helix-turn-helix domain-containing protein [Aestuariivita boseongensis]
MHDTTGASTFAKGLHVLECFQDGSADLTMADISRLTGYDRATARRLCLTLEAEGYLIRTNRSFRLAPKIVALAGGYLASHHIGKFIQPVLNQLAETLAGDVALAVRDDTRAVYIARSAVSTARLSFGFSVGSTLPLLPTAMGRMLLAQCDPDRRDTLLARLAPQKLTPETDMDMTSIRARIDQASQDGFSFAKNEFETGTAGLAVGCGWINGCEAALGMTEAAAHFDKADVFDTALEALTKAAIGLKRQM